jgi:hypothetical protein
VGDDSPVNRLATAIVAAAGLMLGVLAYRVQMDNLLQQTTALRSWASVAAAWSFLVAGLVAWRRRPGNRLGPLMVATCFALLCRQFRYSGDPLAFTVFFAFGESGSPTRSPSSSRSRSFLRTTGPRRSASSARPRARA